MLVLTRKRNETIEVGASIVIRIVQIKGNKVRIGIEAPAEWSIRRGEVQQRNSLLDTAGLIVDDRSARTDE